MKKRKATAAIDIDIAKRKAVAAAAAEARTDVNNELVLSPADSDPRNGHLFLKCPACGSIMTGYFYQICEVPRTTRPGERAGDFPGDCSTLDLECPCGTHFHGYVRIQPPPTSRVLGLSRMEPETK